MDVMENHGPRRTIQLKKVWHEQWYQVLSRPLNSTHSNSIRPQWNLKPGCPHLANHSSNRIPCQTPRPTALPVYDKREVWLTGDTSLFQAFSRYIWICGVTEYSTDFLLAGNLTSLRCFGGLRFSLFQSYISITELRALHLLPKTDVWMDGWTGGWTDGWTY